MNESLTVYTLPNCMQCTMTKRALDDAGLPYAIVDLATDEGAVDTVRQLGYTSALVVIVGAGGWSGFHPDKIKAVASARATELYAVPADPMDELGCESCQ